MNKLIYFGLLILVAVQANAQFTVDGQIRPRFEHRNGYKQLRTDNTESSNFVSQRSRIRFAFAKDNLEMKISFQDVHTWGALTPKKTDAGTIGLHEGWAKIMFTDNCFVKVGRQELLYDNGRLITNSNWNQVGYTHDALRVGYLNDLWNIETVFAYNQNGKTFENNFYNGLDVYKALNTIWVSRKFENLSLALLNVADVKQKNDSTNIDYFRNTIGPTVKYTVGIFGADARAYYQFGKNQAGNDLSAYYVNADVHVKPTDKFKATLGFELKSGNDATDTTSTTDHAFDILYGARHKFNGLIDYFNLPKTTKNGGLIDIYLMASFKIHDKVTLLGQYHNFSLQNKVWDADKKVLDKALGNEIDLVAKIKFSKIIALDLGFSTMFATKSMEVIKGGNSNLFTSYAFAMLTIKPTLFSTK